MRLIDADALKETWLYGDHSLRFVDYIENAPTIDAEPVVRCKDCKYFTRFHNRPMCARTAVKENGHYYGLIATKENHYCSYGAKMDEEENK